MKFKSLFDAYILNLSIYKRPGYVQFNRQYGKIVLDTFGDVEPSSIDLVTILAAVDHWKASGLLNNTINKRLDTFKRILRFGGFHDHPVFEVKKLKEKMNTYGYLEKNEVRKVLKYIESLSVKEKLVVYLILDSGVRVNELLHIKVEELDLRHRCINISFTKTDVSRSLYLTVGTVSLIKDYLKQYKPKVYLFENPRGKMYGRYYVEDLFKRLQKKTKTKVAAHRLRHTLSTHLYRSNANLMFIMQVMGHTDPKTTKRYIHGNIDKDVRMYDRFNKPYGVGLSDDPERLLIEDEKKAKK